VSEAVEPDTVPIDDVFSRPDVRLEQHAEVAMVRRALATLPSTYREAVALRDIHELSYEEIARRLQLSEGTVKSRINRGRRALGRQLQVLLKQPHERSGNGRRTRRREASHAND